MECLRGKRSQATIHACGGLLQGLAGRDGGRSNLAQSPSSALANGQLGTSCERVYQILDRRCSVAVHSPKLALRDFGGWVMQGAWRLSSSRTMFAKGGLALIS